MVVLSKENERHLMKISEVKRGRENVSQQKKAFLSSIEPAARSKKVTSPSGEFLQKYPSVSFHPSGSILLTIE